MNDRNKTHETISDKLKQIEKLEEEIISIDGSQVGGQAAQMKKRISAAQMQKRISVLPLYALDHVVCPECKRRRLEPHSDDAVPTSIPPGTTVTFRGRSQDVFRPTQLVLSGGDLEGLYIDEIRIGNISQFSSMGSLPAREFRDEKGVISPKFTIDTAQVSQDVSVYITNKSKKPLVCEAFFLGRCVRF